MQIGEKVRFLNETGGGIIAGFQGKDIVLVRDEDGFDIPMLRSQVVVIETNANNFVRKPKQVQPVAEAAKPAPTPAVERHSLKVAINELSDVEEADVDTADMPLARKPKPVERKGGDLLNVCLAFVPEDSRELSNTRFEAYLVNDSNYYVSAVVANNEGAAWHVRWQGLLAPNTKQLMEKFDRSILNDLERISVLPRDASGNSSTGKATRAGLVVENAGTISQCSSELPVYGKYDSGTADNNLVGGIAARSV